MDVLRSQVQTFLIPSGIEGTDERSIHISQRTALGSLRELACHECEHDAAGIAFWFLGCAPRPVPRAARARVFLRGTTPFAPRTYKLQDGCLTSTYGSAMW